ncbi:MAG: hypothetical protein K8R46_03265 [Pirellulales bacterium]|nr:hypothetical protein [Pirellulales bacterium]
MGEMSLDGGCDEGKNIATPLTTTLNHRQHRLHKSTAADALSSKRQLTPNYRVTQRTLARVVRRLNIFIPQKRPQPPTMLVQLPACAAHVATGAFRADTVSTQSFLTVGKVIRMGIPPVRINLVTRVDGIDFAQCFPRRTLARLDDVEVNLIGLDDLKANKRAVGRPKDIDDLEHL